MAKNRRNLKLVFFVALITSVITVFIGCGGGGSGDDPLPIGTAKNLKITGNVNSATALSNMFQDSEPSLRGALNASGVTVYIESDKNGHSTVTDSNGNYVLDHLQPGTYNVVAVIKTASNKIYKARSNAVSVSDAQTTKNANPLQVRQATDIVTGYLKNSSGQPIPNARLTLWGSPFYTNASGAFTTPPMPNGVTAPIIGNVAGYRAFATNIPFNSVSGQSVEQVIVPINATNRAPNVSLYSPRYTLSPNEQITLTATATDPDGDSLTYTWHSTSGTLGNSSRYSNTWTSPSNSVIATVSCTVSDPDGLRGTASVTLIVGDASGTQPTNTPPVIMNIAVATTTFMNNTSYDLTASASDIDGDTLTYFWSAAQGTITPTNARTVSWHTPNISGTQYIQVAVIVNDGKGGSSKKVATFTVSTNPNPPANQAPVVTISSPIQASLHAPGYITYSGAATDAEDGVEDASSFVWYQAIQGQSDVKIGEKNRDISLNVTVPATYVVTLQVNDVLGAVGEASVTFRINATPTASIISPANAHIFQKNESIAFIGSGNDIEDGSIPSASLTWTFDDSQKLTGTNVTRSDLTAGTQTIKLQSTDRLGAKSDVNSIQVYINTNPEITSVLPASGSDFLESNAVSFSMVASDPDGAILPANVEWLEGTTLLGTGNPFSINTLSSGNHTIIASISDGMGGHTSSTTFVIINKRPAMKILQPANGVTIAPGQVITFVGSGTSSIGDIASSTMIWDDYSVNQGATSTLKTGVAQFTKTYSSSAGDLGTHIIRLTGADKFGVSSYTQKTIYINATPTVSITSPASGTRFDSGQTITFESTTSDPDTSDSLSVSWLDNTTPIGTGKTFTTNSLASGDHNIFCKVTDSHGGYGMASIAVLVNTLPVATISWTTPQYATAPGNIPVFISQNSSMKISFSASTYDQEIGGNVPSDNIKWFTNSGSNESQVGTGTTLTTSFSIGVSTLTLKVYDSFYPAFEDQASYTHSISVDVWQSVSYSYDTNGLLHGATFISPISLAKTSTFYIAFNNDGSPEIRKYTFHGDFGSEYLTYQTSDSYSLIGTYSFSAVTGVGVLNNDLTALGVATGAFTIASFTGTNQGDNASMYNPGNKLNNSTAFASDNVRGYISNAGDNSILMINPNTRSISQTVTAANNKNFNNPNSVRYNNSSYGKVFVADHDNNRVVRFGDDVLGTVLAPITASGPDDIAFSATYLFTVDSASDIISVFDPNTQTKLMQFGSTGTGLGQFQTPIRILCSGYDLFVIDSANNRLQIIRSGLSDWFK